MTFDYDLFVIGAGSGGVRASRIASSFGAKVAVAEEYRVGGTCVIRGCVPKKLLVYASHFSEDFHLAEGFGWTVGETSFDWKKLIERKDAEIDRLNGLYINTLNGAGVEIINGRATVEDANTVRVGDKTYTAKKILVAVGGWPSMPDVPGIEHAISSNEALHLEEQPKRIVVVGGGYIAVEFAGIFAGMGSEVIQLYRGDQILRGFDDDLRERLAREMTGKGIDLRLGTNITEIEKTDDGVRLTLTDGSTLDADAVMYATGRVPKTEGLGLENAGVEMERGAVKVDAYSRTNVPSIFAVGDVTNRVQLTPVAIKEGHAFALTEFGGTEQAAEHDAIPSAVFSQPPIGTVGLSEAQAREKYGEIEVYTSDFKPMKHTLGGSDERAFTKMIVDKKTDVVVGAHMIGADAAEIIQGVGIAVKAGLTKAQFDATVAVHPSSAEEFVLMRNAKS
ncbi:glutathione-disulfide reductase [Kordiimonas sp. SCSIO 12603]|uniref:glutathione-disulfide reductase n=1 Tax=Kordiimonas sp. SCSIO 12603 TaxID=2829596 RepID=UPI0021037353|nr:glutathione-disulfide reductase [Kordiimonas sp. SCSIO 12603]UTW59566.1 glutathione-disulfide reductase [Kordiimonas sp. SCSIO 12603]